MIPIKFFVFCSPVSSIFTNHSGFEIGDCSNCLNYCMDYQSDESIPKTDCCNFSDKGPRPDVFQTTLSSTMQFAYVNDPNVKKFGLFIICLVSVDIFLVLVNLIATIIIRVQMANYPQNSGEKGYLQTSQIDTDI